MARIEDVVIGNEYPGLDVKRPPVYPVRVDVKKKIVWVKEGRRDRKDDQPIAFNIFKKRYMVSPEREDDGYPK